MHYLYKITNIIDGKLYIGQTVDPNNRWKKHRFNAKQVRVKKGTTMYIHNAMAKHGLDNFIFEVIGCCRSQDDANYTEAELIKQYDSLWSGYGYNVAAGGQSSPKSEETKKKLSEYWKQWYLDHPEQKQIIAERQRKFMTGRKASDEHRQAISEAHKRISHDWLKLPRKERTICKEPDCGRPSHNFKQQLCQYHYDKKRKVKKFS